jgi:putative transposase
VISDEWWELIGPVLPSDEGRRGRRWRDHRQVLEAIAWLFRTGAPWRDVPAEFGPWQTLWKRHRRWSGDGTYQAIFDHVLASQDAAGKLDWLVSADSTIVRAHQHSAGAPGSRRQRSSSRPISPDPAGLPVRRPLAARRLLPAALPLAGARPVVMPVMRR